MNAFLTCSDNVRDTYLKMILYSYNKLSNDYRYVKHVGGIVKALLP